MGYLEEVVGTGGHGAPAEKLDKTKISRPSPADYYEDFLDFDEEDLLSLAQIEIEEEEDEDRPPAPPGYHYMPDGKLMRDDAHDNEAAASDGPCWPGYVQIGMKEKDGKMVPNCVPAEEAAAMGPIAAGGYLVPEEQDFANALLEIVEKHGKFNADNTGVWAGYTPAGENIENAEKGVKCGNCIFWEAPNGCKIIIAETEEGGLCRFAVLPDGAVSPKKNPVDDYFVKSPRLVQEELKKKIKEMENQYKEEYVEISDLTPTQKYVNTDNFKDAESYGKPITVYKDSEGMKLVDGHHRCATRVKGGHRGIKAKVYQGPLIATAGSKPAPKKDQIKGSKKNKKGSAATGKGIKFTDSIITALEKKVKTHNEKVKGAAGKKASLTTLKAVYRRGAGAFSTSHRPDQNRNSWAMARVNAYLHLLKTGSPKNSKYTTDNDLLPKSHPKSTR